MPRKKRWRTRDRKTDKTMGCLEILRAHDKRRTAASTRQDVNVVPLLASLVPRVLPSEPNLPARRPTRIARLRKRHVPEELE